MLGARNNEELMRVDSGTPMGELMRQYWLPAARSAELPEPGCDPLRVCLLGERLVAFRDEAGRVGLVHHLCPHRGASLFYGRNEPGGLRCIFHGWKFDVAGRCVDMPTEPPESTFKDKVRVRAYPCVERNGIIWTYMGPRQRPPALPLLEANMDPEATISTMLFDCNWVQALEGGIDTAHFAVLHVGHLGPEHAASQDNFMALMLKDRAPRYSTLDTDYGACYGAYRPATASMNYWRITQFLMPFYTMPPVGALAANRWFYAWVPMDDEHTMVYSVMGSQSAYGLGEELAEGVPLQAVGGVSDLAPDGPGWFERSRTVAGPENDHLLNRDLVRSGQSFTGFPSVIMEDKAITESMGPLADRQGEHLCSSDAMIIRTRRRLLQAARALRDSKVTPPGVDDPKVYGQRGGGLLLPADANWWDATKHFRGAFVEHAPEVILRTIGRSTADAARQ